MECGGAQCATQGVRSSRIMLMRLILTLNAIEAGKRHLPGPLGPFVPYSGAIQSTPSGPGTYVR
ncbi:hypothetical protein CBM2615_B150083 [Cupriavidus taiwanensis]|uniref:Uncharacterized protein n=1 Tax=Cupriavidus taiwanensis TaxID=164546 RepID=A0A375E6V3_9BURK|nr:hypothetical protein CBM2614_B160086 [Cupriavidus taiwanensis]SOZ65085.1 hypothetical protein CBM2615_B150083 [Cupriavidus taiwanensis]SOZ68777.1 hypothetical protein CBM2613_B120083 [Cupriavidus taiwanensis]SPA08193.1 hypothetical protein CBM2625_B120082 [Cupriavidus taiwanensis]